MIKRALPAAVKRSIAVRRAAALAQDDAGRRALVQAFEKGRHYVNESGRLILDAVVDDQSKGDGLAAIGSGTPGDTATAVELTASPPPTYEPIDWQPPTKPAIATVQAWFEVLLDPNYVVELRALDYDPEGRGYPYTAFGYFDFEHRGPMVRKALELSGNAKGVYFTVNPLLPDLLARVNNRIKRAGKGDESARDGNTAYRAWLPVDLDPVRLAGIPATEAEKQESRAVAVNVMAFLKGQGWPDPVVADSGNGIHVLYPIKLPTDDGDLVRNALRALAAKFNTKDVVIDPGNFNPARIWKFYGTVAAKGDGTPERPHRRSGVLKIPEVITPVSEGLLVALAAEAPKEAKGPAKSATQAKAEVAHYDYRDAAGNLVFQAVRFEPKDFRQRRPDPANPGAWVWDLAGVTPVPYRLPELLAADPAEPVFIPEGEKDVDRLAALGLVATCNPMGAGKWRDEYSPHFQGRAVVVMPDNDDTGRNHADQVARSLLPFAASVKVVELPGLPPRGDVSDWLDGGGTVASLKTLVDAAPAFVPDASTAAGAAGGVSTGTDRHHDPKCVLTVIRPRILELVEEWGLDVTGEKANPKGWWKCRACDRDDENPSASINERSGIYHDFATGENLNLFELAVRLGAYTDATAAADALGDQCGLPRPGPATAAGWPDPGPLREDLLPVPTLDPGTMIPAPFRGWLVDIAERIGCSLEFAVVGAIVALAAVVGRQVGVRPKRHDDWTVVPNLWGAIVGRPGVLKTPPLQEILKPSKRLAHAAREQYEAALKAHAADAAVAKAQRDNLERRLKKAVDDAAKKTVDDAAKTKPPDESQESAPAVGSPEQAGGEPAAKPVDEVESIRAELVAWAEPEPPAEKRYDTNDPTVEKLGELLAANPRGILVFRDELVGYLRNLDRAGHENDRSFYLEAWNGTGSYTYDRIGRGTLRIEAACVSILGGIQPGPMSQYLRDAAGGGARDDGLVSRFQMLVYPTPPKAWTNVDRWPDKDARNAAYAVFQFLDNLDPAAVGAEPDPDDPEHGVPFVRFEEDAQALFNEWREDLERKLRDEGESPLIESHLSKYRSLMPSLALLFHLIDVAGGAPPGPVSHPAALMAAGWCDYLEAHARRVYHATGEGDLRGALALASKIRTGKVVGPFAVREVWKHHWSALDTPQDADRAVAVLEELGWLRAEVVETGGRPQTVYHANPKLNLKAEGAQA